MRYLSFVYIFFVVTYALPSQSVRIQFPDEELSSEVAFPVFQNKRMVLDRRIQLKHRVELGGSLSFGLDEPFYYPIYGTGMISFYFSEIHGVSLTGTYFFPMYSSSGRALKEGKGLASGSTFDVLKAPYPQMMGFLNYKYVPYYGKISLSKKFILNLSIYAYMGPGVMIFNHGTQTVSGNFGIGQKLYFSKWMALRGDIGFYGYYGPAPARINLGNEVSQILYQQLEPQHKRLILNFMANIGMVFLI